MFLVAIENEEWFCEGILADLSNAKVARYVLYILRLHWE